MALSIGISSGKGCWKTCLIEDGRVLDASSFEDAKSTFTHIEQLCAWYPEPIIALASHLATPFCQLSTLSENASQLFSAFPHSADEERDGFPQFLSALSSISLTSYGLPDIKHLFSVPVHRKLYRNPMGDASLLCSVATLLYRMRLRDAPWPQMRFYFLSIDGSTRNIAVVEDGRIIDGIGKDARLLQPAVQGLPEDAETLAQAFWESLSQDLAGLMAIHHLEDIVLRDDSAHAGHNNSAEAALEHLGHLHQIYLFPDDEPATHGFEVAFGAALLAQGLHYPGLAAEVVERLLSPRTLAQQFYHDDER
ncbi:DUF1464 domain-containing protein [Ktedonosporobacter rubrisoli]|uniref:DUF1464 domain-containing protein n=1 Tax=Ktedonosporobacter rubrisoli TaxID=2509675 RepID=A0A4P6K5B1_KTERU|nr:DUF1464 family protein [Ktedonosporobacter rubrisoli]QBD82726.1 DUF1464 domain-containing protein [Ktedonosporobacter rubrisoli]